MRPLVALLSAGALVASLTACTTATDDELEPVQTPTVTVTKDPVQALPEQLGLSSDVDFDGEVVWADGSQLHVGERTIDVAPLVPEDVVVLDQGLVVLADSRVWFVAGRSGQGLPLPLTSSLGLSADGSQLVLDVEDRDEPVAYDTSGTRVAEGSVAALRSPRRTTRGPGEYAVLAGGAGVRVVDAVGSMVPVQRLPDDLSVRGWTGPRTFFGVGRLPDTDYVDGATSVVSCTLGEQARCRALGSTRTADADDLVFGEHPAG